MERVRESFFQMEQLLDRENKARERERKTTHSRNYLMAIKSTCVYSVLFYNFSLLLIRKIKCWLCFSTIRKISRKSRRSHCHVSNIVGVSARMCVCVCLHSVCCALYHLTHVTHCSACPFRRFPAKTKNRHVRRKYIAHVGAVT